MIAAFISLLVPVAMLALETGASDVGGRVPRAPAAGFAEANGDLVARTDARAVVRTDGTIAYGTNGREVVVAVTKTDGDAAVMKRAKALLAGLQTGTIDRSELSAALSADYTPAVLANAAKTLPKGNPKEFALLDKTDTNGTTTYVYRVGWDAGDIDYVFGFDDATYEVTKLFTRPGPPQ